jgi:holliday junction DNA helicase RuvB
MLSYDTKEYLIRLGLAEPESPNGLFEPQNFNEYIGQRSSIEILKITIKAAQKENRALPSIMLTGPAGVGKTTLARLIVENFAGKKPKILDGSSFNKEIPDKGLLVVDEIHNIDSDVCDTLNQYLDRGALQIVGATTDLGILPAPFRSRFRTFVLDDYTIEEIAAILSLAIKRKNLRAQMPAILLIAKRSKYNPRTGLKYLSMIFDYMTVSGQKDMSVAVVESTFSKLDIDERGFTSLDRKYLAALSRDKPIGLQLLSAITGADQATILEEIEPFLLHEGLIDRTSRGRLLI